MTDTDRELGLQDEDRLPWLEAVESDEYEEGLSGSKLMGFLVAALLALGLVIGGIWWLRSQNEGPNGDGTLIAAQEGDYKVKPDDPGGMKVEGQGDSAFAASEGAEANGQIDQKALPEAPVAGKKDVAAPGKPAMPAKPAVTALVPPSGGAMPSATPGKPVAGAAPAAAGGTGLVQLGAYGSQASAETAWKGLTAKYPVLARLNKSVVPAAVGGNTLYRLRANAGSPANAAAVCGQVGNCMVVK